MIRAIAIAALAALVSFSVPADACGWKRDGYGWRSAGYGYGYGRTGWGYRSYRPWVGVGYGWRGDRWGRRAWRGDGYGYRSGGVVVRGDGWDRGRGWRAVR
jgi:hypothetical protein